MWVQTPWGVFEVKSSFFMYNTIFVYILRVPVSMKGSKGHQRSRKQRKQTGFKELAHICVLCSAIASPSLLSSSPIRVNPSGCGCVPVSAPGSQTARVGGCGSWLVSGWRGRAWACVWVCSWRGLMGWWAVWAWLVCVGVGYVCAEGAVGWAGAPWAMQSVEVMLVTPTGGCCRRRNGSVLLTWVLRVMRRAATRLVTLLVS